MTTDFTLVPYVGALPVRFDMNPSEVAIVLGAPARITTGLVGQRSEDRGPVSIRYTLDDIKVNEVSLGTDSRLWFHEQNLMEVPDLVGFLMLHDSEPFEDLGFLLFFELGLAITGFHDGDDDDRAITAFRRGAWDEFKAEAQPFSLQS
jgi:hypothetical protein